MKRNLLLIAFFSLFFSFIIHAREQSDYQGISTLKNRCGNLYVKNKENYPIEIELSHNQCDEDEIELLEGDDIYLDFSCNVNRVSVEAEESNYYERDLDDDKDLGSFSISCQNSYTLICERDSCHMRTR